MAAADPWADGVGEPRAVAHDRHVKWNEAELDAHDATRGTRQPIEHPETPFLYHRSGYNSGEDMVEATADGPVAVNPDHLKQRLGVLATLQEAEVEAERAELERQAAEPVEASLFELKRKALMDEQAASLLKILSGTLDVDEDEEDEQPAAPARKPKSRKASKKARGAGAGRPPSEPPAEEPRQGWFSALGF
eukprot:TRINITY_DN3056_c0_g1_i1.p1 TRINITY_DN3056_c0_g1~~TRINITY_DN3056_c0_g1_i1.p1  ORF type:complete len:192 (+),score=65.76 TRINITY_DN3056_c0_g1_i1:922-1497(+)